MAFLIRGIDYTGAAMLAPMAGVTDAVFRMICRSMGCSLAVTPMVSAKGLVLGGEGSYALLERETGDSPLGAQLFGNEPETIARAAAQIAPMGFDWLDINMGCPVPKVTSSGQGSALMLDPPLAGRVLRAAVRAQRLPVSAKIRLGWSSDSKNAVELARRLEGEGASFIAVHGRTRDQGYSGRADWRAIADVKAAVNIPVVGNGDVSDAHQARARLEESGCDAVMIGRAALGNPWIFERIRRLKEDAEPVEPTAAQRLGCLMRHAHLLAQKMPEPIAMRQMRKHAAWYVKGIPGAAAFRQRAGELTSLDVLERLCAQWLERLGD